MVRSSGNSLMAAIVRGLAGGILALGVTLSPGGHLRATTTLTLDFEWWQTLDSLGKINAVQGMFSGFRAGYDWTLFQISINTGYKDDAERKRAAAYWITHTASTAYNVGAGVPFGKVVDRLDAIYLNHPKLATTLVSSFIVCAASKSGDCSAQIRQSTPQ